MTYTPEQVKEAYKDKRWRNVFSDEACQALCDKYNNENWTDETALERHMLGWLEINLIDDDMTRLYTRVDFLLRDEGRKEPEDISLMSFLTDIFSSIKQRDAAAVIEVNDHIYLFRPRERRVFLTPFSTFGGIDDDLYEDKTHMQILMEDCAEGWTNWTVPKTARIGDIVLFYYNAGTTLHKGTIRETEYEINKMRKQIEKDYLDPRYPVRMKNLLMVQALYQKYHRSFCAVGRIAGQPEEYILEDRRYKKNTFADIDHLFLLQEPLDQDDFIDFMLPMRPGKVSTTIEEAYSLRDAIKKKNRYLPLFFTAANFYTLNRNDITQDNFLDMARKHGRHYLLEEQFRENYVDFVLNDISGKKGRDYWAECYCVRKNTPDKSGKKYGFVDNVFTFNGVRYLLEVKLSVEYEHDLPGQMDKYVLAEKICYTKRKKNENVLVELDNVEQRFAFIIDSDELYVYDSDKREYHTILALDDVQSVNDIRAAMENAISEHTENILI